MHQEEILALYCAHAPFGGNIVGLEAASWRYYGVPAGHLSWEATALAVLPNAPSTVLPGRNEEVFKGKRDRLLDRLLEKGHIDSVVWRLSKAEPLPGRPLRCLEGRLMRWIGNVWSRPQPVAILQLTEHCSRGFRMWSMAT